MSDRWNIDSISDEEMKKSLNMIHESREFSDIRIGDYVFNKELNESVVVLMPDTSEIYGDILKVEYDAESDKGIWHVQIVLSKGYETIARIRIPYTIKIDNSPYIITEYESIEISKFLENKISFKHARVLEDVKLSNNRRFGGFLCNTEGVSLILYDGYNRMSHINGVEVLPILWNEDAVGNKGMQVRVMTRDGVVNGMQFWIDKI